MAADKQLVTDVEFANAVRSAAMQMQKSCSGLRAAASKGFTTALLDHLRSDKELGAGEREMIADLLAGEIARWKGRRSLTVTETTFRKRSCGAYRSEMKRLKAIKAPMPHQEKAIETISKEINRTPDALRSWLRKGF